jgi:hypothetical protein
LDDVAGLTAVAYRKEKKIEIESGLNLIYARSFGGYDE